MIQINVMMLEFIDGKWKTKWKTKAKAKQSKRLMKISDEALLWLLSQCNVKSLKWLMTKPKKRSAQRHQQHTTCSWVLMPHEHHLFILSTLMAILWIASLEWLLWYDWWVGSLRQPKTLKEEVWTWKSLS